MEERAMRESITRILLDSLRNGEPIMPGSILHYELEDLLKEPEPAEAIGDPVEHVLGLAAFRQRRASRR